MEWGVALIVILFFWQSLTPIRLVTPIMVMTAKLSHL